MSLELQPYLEQTALWPRLGRSILAQYDDNSIIVYQAYKPSIGHFAAQNGHFGGDFSFSRMSWVKPNFLWMMYRCGWAEKLGQECVLAIRLQRTLWDEILSLAVPSTFVSELYPSEADWKRDVTNSDVRLQWDPDHSPRGGKLERRAIQLGLRGEILRRFATEPLAIEDISDFVRQQKPPAAREGYEHLQTPRERPYPVTNPATARRLGMELLDTSRAGENDAL